MTSFYYSYQNPWVCCFLVQIKAIVLLSSAELANLNNKAKTEWILVVVVKYRHRAIILLSLFHKARLALRFPAKQYLLIELFYIGMPVVRSRDYKSLRKFLECTRGAPLRAPL